MTQRSGSAVGPKTLLSQIWLFDCAARNARPTHQGHDERGRALPHDTGDGASLKGKPMCNLYSSFTTQETMRRAFEVTRDNAGTVPPLPAIFPDQMAPVVRMHEGERELLRMRWGFPPPPKDRKSTRLNSSHANISYAVFCLKKK